MPIASNITVKNAALVDKTFTVLTPASGDGGIARFALKEGAAPAAYPSMTVVARPTANRSRKTQYKVNVPFSYVDPITGITKRGPSFELNVEASMPDDFPDAMRDDAVAFGVNLLSSASVKAAMRDGYGLV